jgi:hypothetical protein
MDTYLSGVSMERNLGSTGRYRILSFGEPVEVSEYRDSQGRTWIKTWWRLDFADSIVLTYILPMPNGPVVFMTRQESSSRHVYEWDMEATCDRIFAGYKGTMEEWGQFLSVKNRIPDSFDSLFFIWDEDEKTIAVDFPQLSLKTGNSVFNWTSLSSLFMAPAYYRKENKIEYGFRSVVAEQDTRGKDYYMIHQHIRPDERLGTNTVEYWNDVRAARHPFDGVSRLSSRDNTGSVGGLLAQPGVSDDVQYSLYLNMENPGSEESLSTRFKTLEEGISILY